MRIPGTLLAFWYCSTFLYTLELGRFPRIKVLGLATKRSTLSKDIATWILKENSVVRLEFEMENQEIV